MMGHFFQVFGLKVVEGLEIILLDVIIQSIFEVSHALKSLS